MLLLTTEMNKKDVEQKMEWKEENKVNKVKKT